MRRASHANYSQLHHHTVKCKRGLTIRRLLPTALLRCMTDSTQQSMHVTARSCAHAQFEILVGKSPGKHLLSAEHAIQYSKHIASKGISCLVTVILSLLC